MSPTFAMRSLALAAALLAAACAEMPKLGGGETPKPAAPQITESSLRERAQDQLATGVKQYDAGDYDSAVKSLSASLEHGLLSKADQARARKLLAFSHCVSGREVQCRDEFRRAFEIYPDFALTPAEDGHPIWGPIYRNVRTQLVAEREAAAGRRTTNILPLAPSGRVNLPNACSRSSSSPRSGDSRARYAKLRCPPRGTSVSVLVFIDAPT